MTLATFLQLGLLGRPYCSENFLGRACARFLPLALYGSFWDATSGDELTDSALAELFLGSNPAAFIWTFYRRFLGRFCACPIFLFSSTHGVSVLSTNNLDYCAIQTLTKSGQFKWNLRERSSILESRSVLNWEIMKDQKIWFTFLFCGLHEQRRKKRLFERWRGELLDLRCFLPLYTYAQVCISITVLHRYVHIYYKQPDANF